MSKKYTKKELLRHIKKIQKSLLILEEYGLNTAEANEKLDELYYDVRELKEIKRKKLKGVI